MKKSLLITAMLFTITVSAIAQNFMTQRNNDNKILIAYFSAIGTTSEAAEKISKLTNGEIYTIAPVNPYSSADLDWHNKQSRSSVEMNDTKSCPALRDVKEDIADYETVFIGYPIWWNLAPRVVNTFIEKHMATHRFQYCRFELRRPSS